ncbi:MAG: hypothetical protein MJ025_00435 [Victivallaceae bacterium]|nr:hypothetical protein [Victivallaceae bacterium]
MNLVVCDSGLGGLDIAAEFFGNGKSSDSKYNVIYVNAWPDDRFGYNQMLGDEESQLRVLRNVMEGIAKFNPVNCVIACNTLCILWNKLATSYDPGFHITGLVEIASVLMEKALARHAGSRLLILGTATTVASGAYENEMLRRGFARERIHAIPCPGLATLIERGPDTPEVKSYIGRIAEQAENKLGDTGGKLLVALCCTHFPYAVSAWNDAFRKKFSNVEILNPNREMRIPGSAVGFEYRSRITMPDATRNAMRRLFSKRAPAITAAIEKYAPEPNLFSVPADITERYGK